jgi:hypothetical protein
MLSLTKVSTTYLLPIALLMHNCLLLLSLLDIPSHSRHCLSLLQFWISFPVHFPFYRPLRFLSGALTLLLASASLHVLASFEHTSPVFYPPVPPLVFLVLVVDSLVPTLSLSTILLFSRSLTLTLPSLLLALLPVHPPLIVWFLLLSVRRLFTFKLPTSVAFVRYGRLQGQGLVLAVYQVTQVSFCSPRSQCCAPFYYELSLHSQ